MTGIWRRVGKESLALAPMWVACCLGAAAAPLWSVFRLDPVGLVAYVFGAVALGAHAFGHEYAHRTMGALLAQPVRRTTIISVKLAVLAAALTSLTAVAWIGPSSPIGRFPAHAALDSRVLFLPTLMGLTLAPYLSLVARSTLGGAVFTIAIPGLLLIASDLLAAALFGLAQAGEIDRFKYAVFAPATVVACIAAAIATWHRFLRLEALDDGAAHVSVSITSDAHPRPTRRARNPYWLLAAKEMRLQQMTFVVVALYVCGWAAGVWAQRAVETAPLIPWRQLNTLYAALLSILIGSLGSAEERQLGTLEWQALLPLAAWKQFAVKVAVICGLVLTAGIALPILLAPFTRLPHMGGFLPGAVWVTTAMALAMAIGSLYVSTISSSGVRAVAAALPVVAGAFVLLQSVPLMLREAWRAGLIPRGGLPFLGVDSQARAEWTLILVAAGIASVFLMHAFRNHAAVDRGMRRVAAQAAAIGAAIVAGGGALFVLGLR